MNQCVQPIPPCHTHFTWEFPWIPLHCGLCTQTYIFTAYDLTRSETNESLAIKKYRCDGESFVFTCLLPLRYPSNINMMKSYFADRHPGSTFKYKTVLKTETPWEMPKISSLQKALLIPPWVSCEKKCKPSYDDTTLPYSTGLAWTLSNHIVILPSTFLYQIGHWAFFKCKNMFLITCDVQNAILEEMALTLNYGNHSTPLILKSKIFIHWQWLQHGLRVMDADGTPQNIDIGSPNELIFAQENTCPCHIAEGRN